MLAVKGLALEVLAKGPVSMFIVLQRVVAVGTQCTGKHSNVAKNGLERFIQNVGHFVLKVLRGNKRI